MAEQPLTYCVKAFQIMEKKRNLFKVVVRDRELGEEHLCFVRCDSSWDAVVICLGAADRETALVSVCPIEEETDSD